MFQVMRDKLVSNRSAAFGVSLTVNCIGSCMLVWMFSSVSRADAHHYLEVNFLKHILTLIHNSINNVMFTEQTLSVHRYRQFMSTRSGFRIMQPEYASKYEST